MPEYTHIQTWVKCDNDNFQLSLKKYSDFLIELGFNQDRIENWVSQMSWGVEENGFMFMADIDSALIKISDYTFKIRPTILGWTPLISEDIPETFLEFNLLLETSGVFNYKKVKYKNGIEKGIGVIARTMFKYFQEYGVFVTDEAQDGFQWERLIAGLQNDWRFDLAIIPNKMVDYYQSVSIGFTRQEVNEGVAFIYESVWNENPLE